MLLCLFGLGEISGFGLNVYRYPATLIRSVPARSGCSPSQPLRNRASPGFRGLVCRDKMSGDGDNEESLGSYAGRIAATLVKAFADEISRNTRWLVSLTAAAILLWRRDAIAVSAIIGALGNAVLSKVLKKILREERPDGAPLNPETKDPGMPSSHAMSLFFLSGYLCAAAITWSGFPPLGIAASCAGLLGFASYAARWRVTAGYHTAPQVIVGSILGGINGVGWQRLTDAHPALVAQGDKLLSSTASLPWVLCGLLFLGGGVVGWKSIKPILLSMKKK